MYASCAEEWTIMIKFDALLAGHSKEQTLYLDSQASIMAELSIAKSLNKAYRHISIDKASFDLFKGQLSTLFEQIALVDTEEKVKGDLMDFLKLTFYRQNYKVSPNGKIDAANMNEEWTDVLDALAQINEEIRMPIVLKHYYGYSYEEIGKMMGIAEGTVKSRVSNGLKSVRKELAELERV